MFFGGRGTVARGTSAAVIKHLQIRDATQEFKHSMPCTVRPPTKLEKQLDQGNTFTFWPTNVTPANFASLFVKIHNGNKRKLPKMFCSTNTR